jgi:hypothetical protein
LWLKVGRSTQYVTVTCPPRGVHGHWDSSQSKSRRCGHDLCQLCALGWERRTFWYIGLLDQDGDRQMLELRESQADIRRELSGMGWDCVGLELAIFKDGPANNSPIRVQVNGRRQCEPNDIAAFVATLGLPPLLTEIVPCLTPQEQERTGERRRPDWGRKTGSM